MIQYNAHLKKYHNVYEICIIFETHRCPTMKLILYIENIHAILIDSWYTEKTWRCLKSPAGTPSYHSFIVGFASKNYLSFRGSPVIQDSLETHLADLADRAAWRPRDDAAKVVGEVMSHHD